MNDMEKKAFDFAFESEMLYGGCPQAVLRAMKECGLPVTDDVIKSATGLAAGVCRCGRSCGALVGGIMAISSLIGRDEEHLNDAQLNGNCIRVCRKLTERFMNEYGTIDCRDIQYKISGRSFAMYDDADRQRFLDAGGHKTLCTNVAGKAAQWVIEILEEEGLMNSSDRL